VCDLLTFERLAELLAVVADGRDGGGDLERRHRGMMQGWISITRRRGRRIARPGRVLKWGNGGVVAAY
jgi:hypothetical protein